MAKRQPTPTIVEMEAELGFGVHSVAPPEAGDEGFYSDLSRVSNDALEFFKQEYAAMVRMKQLCRERSICSRLQHDLPGAGETITYEQDGSSLSISCYTVVGYHRFVADLKYNSISYLRLYLSELEVFEALSVQKLRQTLQSDATSDSPLSELPLEIRERIYTFATHSASLTVGEFHTHQTCFTRGLGDLGGFYFPFGSEAPVLQTNRRVRGEALPCAFQQTTFELDDMDDAVRLLIAIGTTGRHNIQSISIAWESNADMQERWEREPDNEDMHLALPILHAQRLIGLLKLCKRLSHICLRFESDKLEVPSQTFLSNPGIVGLFSLQTVRAVDIVGLAGERLEESYPLVRTLKERILSGVP